MVSGTNPPTIRTKLIRVAKNVALSLPESTLRQAGLLAGMPVRVVLLDGEIRVRRASALHVYDLESLDDYRERLAKEELEQERLADRD